MTVRRLALPLLLLPALCACPLAAAEPVAVGSQVGNLSFTDIRYTQRSLDDFGRPKAVVLVFVQTGCPLVPKYLAALDALERAYRGKGVQFVAVNVGPDDTVLDMAAQAVELNVGFPFVKDFDGRVLDAVGATRTPEVVLLDGGRRVRYRGRIDDQHRPGGSRPEPTRRDLKEALDEVLAGKDVSVPQTTVDGCLVSRAAREKPEKPVTYAEQVGPILVKHCADCHRPGAEAPFSLATFEQAKARGKMIAEVVREGRMPPWFAAPGHGPFVNKRGLTAAERELVLQWVEGGTAPGDLTKAPAPPPARTTKWAIAEPDLVLTTKAFELPATGDIAYQYAILSHYFAEDTWVQGVEILPEDRKLVHHANLAHVSLGEGFKEANLITGVVPGGDPLRLEEGVAYRIPKGSALALQIHFVASGKPETTRVSVGLRFARGAVRKQLRHVLLVDTKYRIPPGEPAHAVTASRVLEHDAVGIGLFTHMHLRGKAMTFRAHLPDGKTETLLTIPNYRFDWQLAYRWEPGKVRLPRGTRVEAVAVYDNSAFNPFNPDPTATVRDGPQTYHEMLNGFFFYLDEAENLNLEIDGKTGQVKAGK
jgi:thiol-disulfide isomerase/thioredoxin/mono/diheme cytochrome c family protein